MFNSGIVRPMGQIFLNRYWLLHGSSMEKDNKKNARSHLVNRLFRPALFIGLDCSFRLSSLGSKSLHIIIFVFILYSL